MYIIKYKNSQFLHNCVYKNKISICLLLLLVVVSGGFNILGGPSAAAEAIGWGLCRFPPRTPSSIPKSYEFPNGNA